MYVHVKDWFKPIFPLFLTRLLRKLRIHGRFAPQPTPSFISQVKPMPKCRHGLAYILFFNFEALAPVAVQPVRG